MFAKRLQLSKQEFWLLYIQLLIYVLEFSKCILALFKGKHNESINLPGLIFYLPEDTRNSLPKV